MKQHGTQRKYWQSLEHLANTPQIEAAVNDEFFGYDPDGMKSIPEASRRRFLQLAGASMALAGLTLTGCRRWPEEKLAPYTSNPANRSAGIPQDYATVMELNGVAQPLLVKSFDGRPIKIEGNPSHPYSATIPGKQGAATRYAQASVLEMYDPNRSRSVIDHNAEPEHATTMDQFEAMLESVLAGAGQGEKMAVLIESTSSPSTANESGSARKVS